MLQRGLFYTAISRAKKQVVLADCKEALHIAMVTLPEQCKSIHCFQLRTKVSEIGKQNTNWASGSDLLIG